MEKQKDLRKKKKKTTKKVAYPMVLDQRKNKASRGSYGREYRAKNF